MALQLPQINPAYLLFPMSGPIFDRIGYWPNQRAANGGVLPSLLGLAGGPGNIPMINDYPTVYPALVTQIFGGAAPDLGTPWRPVPYGGLTPNAGGGIVPPQYTLPGQQGTMFPGGSTLMPQYTLPGQQQGGMFPGGGPSYYYV